MNNPPEGLLDLLIDSQIRRLLVEHGLEMNIELRASSPEVDEAAGREKLMHALRARHEREIEAQKFHAIGQLGAGLAHEIRNIASVIRGFAQVTVRKADEPDRVRTLATSIEREALRCTDSIGGLLTLARRASTEHQLLSVNDTVTAAARLVRYSFALQGIELRVMLGTDLPAVSGNANQLLQVLLNLLLNAQHSIVESGTVTMTSAATEGGVEIAVTDTGQGIPEHLRERIFEPFFTTKLPGQGTGLGLAICKQLIESHHGHLGLESPDSGGTRFIIALPIARD